mmetsp:Transcript_19754/g.14491  ORF Transcript_19754/g.14491 Transcript_19754/m.14491 type:complete len:108 (-) Transcript_19754:3173-3496(-)
MRDGWEIYADPIREFERQGLDLTNSAATKFRILKNDVFSVCSTYPPYLIVPKSMHDSTIVACSKFRTKNRFPALTFYDLADKVSLWRSSQTMSGFGLLSSSRSIEDE